MAWTKQEARELIRYLEDDYTPRSYSGRGMMGKTCLGITLDAGSLWELATELARNTDFELPAPKTDSMGLGVIAYWPQIPWVDPDPTHRMAYLNAEDERVDGDPGFYWFEGEEAFDGDAHGPFATEDEAVADMELNDGE